MTFKRENRYIVFKLNKMQSWQIEELLDCVYNNNFDDARVDSLVIEKDWPEYEIVWDMIEKRMKNEKNI